MMIVYVFACAVLIFVILIQAGDKGGGLSSLGSSNQGISDALGATGAEKTLNKWTTWCACTFILLAIALSYAVSAQARSRLQVLPSARDLPAATTPANAAGGAQGVPAGAVPSGATGPRGATGPTGATAPKAPGAPASKPAAPTSKPATPASKPASGAAK
jgi:protein translocase SecG subunit